MTFLRHLPLLVLAASLAGAEITPDAKAIRRHAETLIEIGDRGPGSPGAEEAAEYLRSNLASITERVHVQRTTLVVPVDHGSWVEVDGERRDLVPHLPNGVALAGTHGRPVTGMVRFLDPEELATISSEELAESIVVLSGQESGGWKRCAEAGARAVIFSEPASMSAADVDEGHLIASAGFPRFVGEVPRTWDGREATVFGDVRWESSPSSSVIGLIRGTQEPKGDEKREAVIVTAGYESSGALGAYDVGTTRAWNAGLLLELARGLAADPPDRDVVVCFHGGRAEFFRGLRQFVYSLADVIRGEDAIEKHESSDYTPTEWYLTRQKRELWKAEEILADFRGYLAALEGGEENREALLMDRVRDVDSEDFAVATAVEGAAEKSDLPLFRPVQYFWFGVLLIAAIWYLIRQGSLDWAPQSRYGLASVWVVILIWVLLSGPRQSAEVDEIETAMGELARHFISDEAARRADAIGKELEARRLEHFDMPDGPAKEEVGQEIEEREEAQQAWRDLQQQIGKTPLESEGLDRLPLVARTVVGEVERDAGSILRHIEQLERTILDTSSSLDVIRDLEDLEFKHLVGIDLTDGNDSYSSICTGYLNPKFAISGSDIYSVAEDVAERTRVPVPFSKEPHSEGDPSGWWPKEYVHPAALTGIVLNSVTFSTIDDWRWKLGSPADSPENFRAENFLAQTSGLTAFLRDYLSAGSKPVDKSRLAGGGISFPSPEVKIESPSEGSATGRKGFSYPMVQLSYSPGGYAKDAWTDYRHGVRICERYWGDAFGSLLIPKLPASIDETRPAQVRAYGVDPNGEITHALAQDGTRKTKNYDTMSSFNLSKKNPGDDKKLLLVFEAVQSRVHSLFDPRLLTDLDKVNVLSAYRNAKPNYTYVELDGDVAAIYTPPDTPLRVLAKEGEIGDRFLLLGEGDPGSDYDYQEFVGLDPGGSLSRDTAFEQAEDVWQINDGRLKRLRENGVFTESLIDLHSDAERHLNQARKARESGDQAEALGSSYASWSISERVYPGVFSVANDVVYGLIIMLMISIPFAWICERLFVAANTIYKKVAGFAGFFVATFMFFFFLHPAFEIAKTPVIIFLSFTIIVLSVLVISIIYNRFEYEMERMRMGGLGIHKVDVSRMGTLVATVTLGISNMRRRPLRTTLTAITVVLMTFILMTFASFNAGTGTREISLDTRPAYRGILFSLPGWTAFDDSVLDRFRDTWGGDVDLHPRRWFAVKEGRTKFRLAGPDGSAEAEGILAFADDDPADLEDAVVRPDGARGFGGDTDWLFVPVRSLETCGLEAGDRTFFRGREFRVGTIDEDALGSTFALGGERLTPHQFRELDSHERSMRDDMAETAAQGQVDISIPLNHLAPDSVYVMHERAAAAMGERLTSIAMVPKGDGDVDDLAHDMAQQIVFPLTVGEGGNTYTIVGIDKMKVAGLGDILIPLILGGLIIFSTMLGSVAERGKEIFIYASLGLAPLHIGVLFLVESAIYAVLGGILGYVLAQLVSTGLGALAEMGIGTEPDLNYSSFTAVITILMVMGTVLVSALYPALVASRAAKPGEDTDFHIPEPEGDRLEIPFPFTVAARDIGGLLAYLVAYLDAHSEASIGCFTAADARMKSGDGEYEVRAKTWLAPFDLGISQNFRMYAFPTDVKAIYQVGIQLELLSGQRSAWRRALPPYLQDLRQQFLVWRTLDEATRDRYRAEGGDEDAARRVEERRVEAERLAEEEERLEKEDKERLKEEFRAKGEGRGPDDDDRRGDDDDGGEGR